MVKIMKKYLISIVLLSSLFLPTYVFALGQTTEPIIIKDALRGEKIQKEIIAVNSDKKDVKIKFSAEGQINGWAKFYLDKDKDFKNPFSTTTIQAQSNLNVTVIIDVPDDVLNGEYKGSISVTNIPDEEVQDDKSRASVIQRIDREVNITVSDHEKIDLKHTSVIPEKYDLKTDEALKIRVIYDNQGNVRLSPQIHLKISEDSEDAKNVYDVILPYPEDENAVSSKSQHEINPILIQTIGWKNGKYLAQLEFLHDNKPVLEKNFSFSIVEKKSLDTTNVNYISIIKLYWVYILIFVILLILLIWQIKRNIDIKKSLKKDN